MPTTNQGWEPVAIVSVGANCRHYTSQFAVVGWCFVLE